MMAAIDFSEIAGRYEKTSVLQSSASEELFRILDIKPGENVLDLGCGTGNLTAKIRKMTSGRVTGVDSSTGMISEAAKKYGNDNIEFKNLPVNEMDFADDFDVIFCNSTFQWFKNPGKALSAMHRALKPGGRVGIQAPATKNYCVNFIHAVEKVSTDPGTMDVYSGYNTPWLFLDTADEYKILFNNSGFKTVYAEIVKSFSKHTPEEAFQAFSSGAIAGYLNKDYYSMPFDENYIDAFKSIVKEDFTWQSDMNGEVELIFNRVFLVAIK